MEGGRGGGGGGKYAKDAVLAGRARRLRGRRRGEGGGGSRGARLAAERARARAKAAAGGDEEEMEAVEWGRSTRARATATTAPTWRRARSTHLLLVAHVVAEPDEGERFTAGNAAGTPPAKLSSTLPTRARRRGWCDSGAAARRCLSPAMISLAQSEPGARPDWGAAVDAPPLRWTDEWLHEVAATTLTTLLGH